VENTADQKMIAEIDTVSMQAFQFPLVFSNACIWLVMMAERWILNHSGLSGDVGGYAAVYQLAFIPMLFISNFMVLLIEPILYQTAHLDREGITPVQVLRINRYAGVGILCVTLVLFLVLLFCYPTVGSFFLGIEFRSYSWIFPWLLLSGGCFAAAQQLLLILNCEMRTDLLAILWGVVATIAIIAYIIGANYWQLKGVIVAIVFVNALLLVFSYLFSNRLFRKSNLGQ
jgi:O-antigen/teichoic acid export membrane protein